MKKHLWFLLVVCASGLNAQVASSLLSSPITVDPAKSLPTPDVGPHHRVWHTVAVDEQGRTNSSSYVEIATGLHYLNPATGQWELSKPEFAITENGYAVATNGQHQAMLAPNVNSAGSVALLAPDGKQFLSNPMGLSFFDTVSGTNVLIAEVKDCIGKFIPPNVILYDDAFTDCKGAIRYTYTKAGFEQDVLIYDSTGLGSPADYGLDPDTTLLEMYSEFHQAPAPQKTAQLTQDNLVDESLNFGQVAIANGKAFGLDAPEPAIPVIKAWQTISGRTFLIESVRFSEAQPFLQSLQAGVAKDSKTKVGGRMVRDRQNLIAMEAMRPRTRSKAVASITPGQMSRSKGFLIDYQTLNSSQTNYPFKGDTTYYITDTVYLSGTTTIEAGAVIKYSTSSSASLWINDAVDCQATAYRPAVFTGKDDNTVGETISGSTGSPTRAGYANYGVVINYGPSTSTALANLRFSYLRTALQEARWSTNTLSHSQILQCDRAIMVYSSTDLSARNVLIDQVNYAFDHGSGVARAENLTIHNANNLKREPYGAHTMYLTNCLMVGVTNVPTSTNSLVTASSVVFTNDQPTIFQSVGAGYHYLAPSSIYRDSGTTNINSALAADLKQRTTYPPIVLTNDFTVNTTLAPQAQRDTDTPDLGYHYDPLDYCWGDRALTNSVLTLTNGVAVGIYGEVGTALQSGGTFISEGGPTALNRLIRYHAVQEQPIVWGTNFNRLFSFSASTLTPRAQLRFTDLPMLAGARTLWNGGYNSATVTLSDCLLRGPALTVYNPDSSMTVTVALTNNLADRVNFNITQGSSGTNHPVNFDLRNNLFLNGTVALTYFNTNNNVWGIYENLFDSVALSVSSSGTNISPRSSNNGYCNTALLPASSGSDVTLASADYQTGPLGGYYYPNSGTNLFSLVNAGSRTADQAGLYHYTTQLNQAKEINSVVDIGFHYVAVDGNGNPLDTDGDGVPDYLEDRNGNGAVESGETDWQSVSDSGLKVWITEPKSNSVPRRL